MIDQNNSKKAGDSKRRSVFMALAGNPNSGKTTIFNAITGARHHVGNYPGVTVERREGRVRKGEVELRVVDLPGCYSLTAYSPDEMVARRTLLDERPDVVIQVVDAGNLERNLYLTVQLLELKVPLVLAFNMMDEVEKKGVKIDLAQLSVLLGAPIVATVGSREEGIGPLLETAIEVARSHRVAAAEVRYGTELDRALASIKSALEPGSAGPRYDRGWIAVKLLEADAEVKGWVREAGAVEALTRAETERARLQKLFNEDPELLMADARYGWLHGAVAETMRQSALDRRSLTDRVDTVLAHRVLGLPIFLFFMWASFYATFKLGEPLTKLMESGFGGLASFLTASLPPGDLTSLLVDGVIGGVGGVLVFLPNIMILFAMVALMEDSGYMSRAAFIVDRVMHAFGLHGKSFIPMFVGFGCNVPGIMAARVLENERDRIATILVCPFVSCSARLPVYVLVAGAFFGARAGTVVFSLYGLGIVVAMAMAKLLRTYVVKGPPTPFVMELPPYRAPTVKSVLIHTWERAWMYVKKAGTIILAFSIGAWFLASYPRSAPPGETYAGRYGRMMTPLLKPIGLGDWRVSVALTMGFAAKEIVVSTMSTLFSLESATGPGLGPTSGAATGVDAEAGTLAGRLRSDGFFTPLRAYVFMVFVLLYVPCLATVAVAYRELGSWKWAALMVGMSMSVAYVTAGAVYWGGRLLGLG